MNTRNVLSLTWRTHPLEDNQVSISSQLAFQSPPQFRWANRKCSVQTNIRGGNAILFPLYWREYGFGWISLKMILQKFIHSCLPWMWFFKAVLWTFLQSETQIFGQIKKTYIGIELSFTVRTNRTDCAANKKLSHQEEATKWKKNRENSCWLKRFNLKRDSI